MRTNGCKGVGVAWGRGGGDGIDGFDGYDDQESDSAEEDWDSSDRTRLRLYGDSGLINGPVCTTLEHERASDARQYHMYIRLCKESWY